MGKHLICDYQASGKQLSDTKYIQNFLNSLVKLIKMNKLTEPIVKEGNKSLPGISGIVLITTSHISIHTFTKQNRLCLDIYSCKNFNENDVLNHVSNYFQISKLLNRNVLVRDDGRIEKKIIIRGE